MSSFWYSVAEPECSWVCDGRGLRERPRGQLGFKCQDKESTRGNREPLRVTELGGGLSRALLWMVGSGQETVEAGLGKRLEVDCRGPWLSPLILSLMGRGRRPWNGVGLRLGEAKSLPLL